MLKRQREGAAMSDPVLVEAGIEMLAEACPDEPARTRDMLRTALDEGFQSIDRKLQEPVPDATGSVQPARRQSGFIGTLSGLRLK